MAVKIQYVVEHKGLEKMVTTDKKEADAYDKMLQIADDLAEFISGENFAIEDDTLEDLSIFLAKNKDAIGRVLKGQAAHAPEKKPKATKEEAQVKKPNEEDSKDYTVEPFEEVA